MIFNSFSFLLFFILVFCLYWFVFNRNLKFQNLLLLISSYVFYAFWDWRFLSLIFISSLSDFIIGKRLDITDDQRIRKLFLVLSIIINLSILGFFKYYNFFSESLTSFFSFMGINRNIRILHIVLPVGISFYTFQTMSYIIDIYRKEIKPAKDPVIFFVYVSFFPQLVAGPIERASHLLPQFTKQRIFNETRAVDGLRQVLWGLVQKTVIADNCAGYVDMAFNNPSDYSSLVLIIAAFLFAIQVYGDFAGYSNMAIGIARLLGFDLMQNFNSPYFSKNITEIWRRWHISLSTWLRDYLFTPLALSTRNWGIYGVLFATIVTFTLSGLWHGANWNFIFWGFLHGLALCYEILTKKFRKRLKKNTPDRIYSTLSIICTFSFWVFGLIFFRSANTTSGFVYLSSIFSNGLHLNSVPMQSQTFTLLILIFLFMIVDYIGKDQQFAIEKIGKKIPRVYRWGIYFFLIFLILVFYPSHGTPFIYFQF